MAQSTGVFVIEGTNRNGETVYYTGKVGAEAMTKHKNAAQIYVRSGLDSNAQRVAEAMNKGYAKHGVRWSIKPK